MNNVEGESRPASAEKVVGVGSSLLRHATFYDEDMDQFAASLGLNLRYRRLTIGLGNIEDSIFFTNEILAVQPDIVLFDTNFLYYRDEDTKEPGAVRFFLFAHDNLIKIMNYLSQKGTPQEIFFRNLNYRETRERLHGNVNEETLDRLAVRLKEFRNFGFRPGYHRMIESFTTAGIISVALTIPIHKKAERTRPLEHRLQMEKELANLENEGLLIRWTCPLSFAEDDYVDARHFAAKARKRFSQWLISQLTTLTDHDLD